MGFDLVPLPVRNFIDSVFGAPLSFLRLMGDMLQHASLIAGRGINLNNYFGFFAYLPQEWQAVVQSALAGVVLLAVIMLVKAAWNTYLNVKASLTSWV